MPYIGNQPGTGVRSRFIYTATASQTTFSGADDNSKTLKYADSAYVDVFLNGVCLVPGTDYTASTKTSIVLTQAASLSDTLEVIAYDIASMSDMSASNGGTFQADVTFAAGADILTASAGTDNVRLGEDAGASIASGGANNVTIGKNAGTAITTGKKATLIGAEAGEALIDGDNNTAVGYQALTSDRNGEKSVAVGTFALAAQDHSSLTDSNNTAVGYQAGTSVTTGTSNTLIGTQAGDALTTGAENVAVGVQALSTEDANGQNVAVGQQALRDLNAGATGNNVAIGHIAGRLMTTGTSNTLIGSGAGDSLTAAHYNIAIGHGALGADVQGSRSVAVGWEALNDQSFSSTTISYNTAVGHEAGCKITTGTNNTCIGGLASQNTTTGSNNVLIGTSAETAAVDTSQVIAIGSSITSQAANNFTFGYGSTDSNIAFGATSITAPSDERYKEEIATSTAGLSFINDLRPVTFKWKKAKDLPSNHDSYIADGEAGCDDRVMLSNGETNHGFIAQEVKAAIDAHSEIKDGFRMWSEDYREDADGNKIADNRQRIAPSELIPMLTKAIQELSAKNDALETENTAIKARLDALEAG